MAVPTAPELARHLADLLEAAEIPYAIGGALALGVWGFPRATNDVDLDLFVPAEALDPAFVVLHDGGCEFDIDEARGTARTRGDFKVWWHRMRVDIFVASIPFYQAAQHRIRQAPLEGQPAWFLAAEDLAVFKMLFFRTKDLLDLERLVAFLGPSFEHTYVRRWLVELVGPDDPRVQRWDTLVKDASA